MAATNYRDKRFRKVQGGPVSLTNVNSTSSNQWFGTTVVATRDQFVSASLVAATSRIAFHPFWTGPTSLSVAPQLFVSSIQAGVGFVLSTVASVGVGVSGGSSIGVWWEIRNPR